MDSIYNKNVSGFNIQVLAEYWETRTAWGHLAVVLVDGREIGRARARYYNRTWEGWRFQTVSHLALDSAMRITGEGALEDYKERTGAKRLTTDKKAGILAAVPMWAALAEARRELR